MKNKILIPLILVFFLGNPMHLNAQMGEDPRADSLELALDHTENPHDRIDLMIRLIRHYQDKDLGKTLRIATEAEQLAISLSDLPSLEIAVWARAISYMRMERKEAAYLYINKWIGESERSPNKSSEAKAYAALALLYGREEMYALSISSFEKSGQIFFADGDTVSYSRTMNNVGVSYELMGEYEKALAIYSDPQLVEFEEMRGHTMTLAQNHENIANIYLKMGKFDSAQLHYDIVQSLVIADTNHYLYGITMIDLGEFNLQTGNLVLAEKYAMKGLALSENFGDPEGITYALNLVSKIKREQNKHEAALDYLHRYWHITDSIKNGVFETKLANSESIHTINSQNQQLLAMTQSEEIQSYRMKFIVWASSSAGIAMLLILIYFIGKTRTNRLKHQFLEEKVDGQKNDLINFSLFIEQKNDLLELFQEEIKVIKKTQNESVRNTRLSELLIQVSQKTGLDRDIELLQAQMKEFGSEFTSQLAERHPDLTSNEKSLAVMLRLGFSSKEIAVATNSVVNTVNVSRYRLRKKLMLGRDENLTDYFSQL